MRAGVALLCLLCGGPALAQETVTSPGPQAVSVTIYRDNLAMVREARRLDLSAQTAVIEFSGVSDGIIAPSAGVSGLPARLVERNFDYDLVTPAALIRNSVGQRVRLIRTLPGRGKVTEDEATILAADEGLLLDINGRTEAFQCSGLPERLLFDRIPDGLRASPTLSARVASVTAGPAEAALHYLTTALGWSANYVATLAADGQTMDLRGAITLTNTGDVALLDAEIFAVAGDLNRHASHMDGGFQTYWSRACWPAAASVDAEAAPVAMVAPLRTAIMDERPGPSREQLADYQLYKLPERTSLAAHQSKQVSFLGKDGVAVRRGYRLTFWTLDFDPARLAHPAVLLMGQNTSSRGLGLPVAAGMVRVLGTGPDGPYPLAEAAIGDIPVGADFVIPLPETAEIAVRSRVVKRDDRALTVEQHISNSKAQAVSVEIEQGLPEGGRIATSSLRSVPVDPYMQRWTVRVPARGDKILRYRIELAARK